MPIDIFKSKRMAQQTINNKIDSLKRNLQQRFAYNPTRAKHVASWNISDMHEIVTDLSNTTLFINEFQKKSNISDSNKYLDDTNITKSVYKNLSKQSAINNANFFETLAGNLSKANTGSQFIEKVIALESVNYNRTLQKDMTDFNDLIQTANKFDKMVKEKTGHLISYDLETLGGINSYGHQQLDDITELSASVFDLSNDNKIVHQKNTLLGFSEDEYKKKLDYLESLRDKPILTNRDEVMLKRFSLFSDEALKDVSFSIAPNQFEYQIMDNSIFKEDIEVSVDKAIEGLKKYRRIGEAQEKNIGLYGQDYVNYKKSYIESFIDLITKGSYNDGTQNVNLSNYVVAAHNGTTFDINQLGRAVNRTIEYAPNTNLDTYQITKYTEEVLGQGAHIPNDVKTTSQYGLATQDQLITMAFGEVKGSHNAKIDENNLAKLLLTPYNKEHVYGDYLIKQLNKAADNINSLYGSYNFNDNGIFFINSTNKDMGGHKNGMSFVWDPVSDSFKTYDGYEISRNGEVNKAPFKQFGPKQNGLYRHTGAYEVDLSSDWKQAFNDLGIDSNQAEKVFQNYSSLDKLYVLKSEELIDKEALEKTYGKDSVYTMPKSHIQIFSSKDELSSAMGTLIGNIEPDGIVWNESAINSLDFKPVNLGDNNIELTANEIGQELLHRNQVRHTSEGAARTFREMDLNAIEKVRTYNKNSHLSISQRIAEAVSKNKTLDISVTEDLINELGWIDNRTKQMKLVPESLNKLTALDTFLSDNNINNFFNILDEVLEEMNLPNTVSAEDINVNGVSRTRVSSTNNKLLKAKRNSIYEYVLSNLLEEKSNNPGMVSNSYSSVFSKDERNKVDFYTFDLFPEKESKVWAPNIANSSRNITTIDLNKKDSLLRTFYNGKFDDRTPIKGNAGYQALVNAYDAINKDPRFNNVWSFNRSYMQRFQNGENLSLLNDKMLADLKSFINSKKEKDINYGLLFDRNIQDLSNPNNISKILGSFGQEELKVKVKDYANKAITNIKYIDSNSTSSVNKLVNDYFLAFNKVDFEQSLKNFSPQQQKVLKMQYALNKQEATKTVKDLLASLKDTDISLGLIGSGKDSRLFLSRGNEKQFLDMHKYVLNNGIFDIELGGQQYAVQTAYNINDMFYGGKYYRSDKSFDLQSIRISNNVENAIQKGTSYSLTAKRASEGQRDILDAIVYRSKKNAEVLRENSPRRESLNFNNTIARAFTFDTNAIATILPDLHKEGILNIINKEYNISPEDIKAMDELIANLNKTGRVGSINKLLASQQNTYFQRYAFAINEYLNENIDFGSIDGININDVMSNLNIRLKDTDVAKGRATLGNDVFAHGNAAYDKLDRPVPIQQGNSILYDRQTLEDELNTLKEQVKGTASEDIFDNIKIGGTAFTEAGYKGVQNAANGKTAGVTLKYLQTDSNTLKNFFLDKEEAFASYAIKAGLTDNADDAKLIANKFMDKALKLSTYEQESVMNSRVAYAFFSKQNTQVIDKPMAINIDETNPSIIKATKENENILPSLSRNADGTFNFKYNFGRQVEKGETLGTFGTVDNMMTSNFKGLFRARYVDEKGQVVPEAIINTQLKAQNLTKDTEVIKFLNEQYGTIKYEVLSKLEAHGHKMVADASEKSTINALDIAIGSIDSQLRAGLIKDGYSDLVDEHISKDYLLALRDADDYFKDNYFNRILKERFSFSDAIAEIIPELKGVSAVFALNAPKHGSLSFALTDVIEQIKQSGLDENKLLTAIYGKDLVINDDGTIITDYTKKLQLDNWTGLTSEEKKFLTSAINKTGTVKGIGSYGKSYLVHVKDDSAGSSAGRKSPDAIQRTINQYDVKLDDINRQLNSLEKGSKEYNSLLIRKDSLKESRDRALVELDKTSKDKGLKFSNRMNLNLNRNVYNEDSLSLVKKALSPDMYAKYFGHIINADGTIKDTYLGESVLAPITQVLRNQILLGADETKLSNIDTKLHPEYKYLLDEYGSIKDTISVQKAETLFSYQEGTRAISFNAGKHGITKKTLTADNLPDYAKFHLVDLSKADINDPNSWLSLDISGQGRTITNAPNNPYSNNLLIKTGLGGENEYLAIAKMPEKYFKGTDSLIKASHISKLNSFQQTLQDLKVASPEEEGKIKARAISQLEEIKRLQVKDVTSKTGLAGELIQTRMSQSFFGKASAITINTEYALGDKKATLPYLRRHNSSMLDRAMFGGKSLLEHYSEGRVIDAVFASRQAFEDMGYFNESFMKNVFSGWSDDTYKSLGINKTDSLTAKMEQLLSTHGDAFIATRFPEILASSDTVVMGYLDKDLKANQLKAVGATVPKLKMDNDGDIFAISRIRTNSGDSIINSFANPNNTQLNDIVKAQQAQMMQMAVTENKYWDSQVRKQIAKERDDISLKGHALTDLAKSKNIDGFIYKNISPGDYKIKDLENNLKDYSSYVQTALDEGNHEASLKAVKAAGKSVEDYSLAYTYQAYKNEMVAKSSKNSIGEINVSNYKVKEAVTSILKDYNQNNPGTIPYEYQSRLMFDMMYISEEAAISAKSSVKGLDPQRAKTWNDNMLAVLKQQGNVEEAKNNMRKWTEDYIISDVNLNQYYHNSQFFRDRMANVLDVTQDKLFDALQDEKNQLKVRKQMSEDFINTLASVSKTEGINKMIDFLSVGHSTTGVISSINEVRAIKGFENVQEVVAKATMKAHNLGNDLDFKYSTASASNIFSTKNVINKVMEESKNYNTKGDTARHIMEGTIDLFKSAGGSKLALGVLGLAAGVMTAGYIGGRPRPADTQAMEEAQDYDNAIPMLMDNDLRMAQGSKSGYVININATSDKGRENTVKALQQALANNSNGSINISMNYNDNYGNINDRDIEKVMEDVLA